MISSYTRQILAVAAVCTVFTLTGCITTKQAIIPAENMPRELNKISSPDYVIEPPDVILVDMVTAVPKPPYRIQPLDALSLSAPDAPVDNPIVGVYPVELDGILNLGAFYGTVNVSGLTLKEAQTAIEKQITLRIKESPVSVTLAQGRGLQQVRGPHLVRLDGVIGLGTYGSVRVVGKTLPEAKRAIEEHLSTYFLNPEISIDITGFNSKVYYVIFDGGGAGQQVVRLPVTGNETVLDAVSQLSGISPIGDTRHMWIARPSPDRCFCQKLPIDWEAITECGDTNTNYQLLAGDRLFVKAYPSVTFSNRLERVLGPVERLFGFTLLGNGLFNSFNNNGGGGFGGGGF